LRNLRMFGPARKLAGSEMHHIGVRVFCGQVAQKALVTRWTGNFGP
jgi:hypothetical protein